MVHIYSIKYRYFKRKIEQQWENNNFPRMHRSSQVDNKLLITCYLNVSWFRFGWLEFVFTVGKVA
jgi:hypothetical protein